MAELSRGQILKNPEVITGATGVGATVRLYDADESAYIDVKTPNAVGAAYTLTLPPDDGAAGQVLQTDGDGVTSWVTVSASAAGSQGQLQFNDTGALAGTAVTADASNIYITSASKIRFNDSDNSNYVAIGASDVVASNITYDLPASHGVVGDASSSSDDSISTSTFSPLAVRSACSASLTGIMSEKDSRSFIAAEIAALASSGSSIFSMSSSSFAIASDRPSAFSTSTRISSIFIVLPRAAFIIGNRRFRFAPLSTSETS